MESHRMPQDVLLAEYHGTFHDIPATNLQNKLDEKRGKRDGSH
jgi:hypothetical protein